MRKLANVNDIGHTENWDYLIKLCPVAFWGYKFN